MSTQPEAMIDAHLPQTEMDDAEIDSLLAQAAQLPTALDNVDAVNAWLAAASYRLIQQQDNIRRLTNIVTQLAELAAGTQQRQVEMRADLLKAGAFEKKSSLIMPGDRR